MTCESKYTIDSTMVLTCDKEGEHGTTLFGEKIHTADAYNIGWYWKDREADK